MSLLSFLFPLLFVILPNAVCTWSTCFLWDTVILRTHQHIVTGMHPCGHPRGWGEKGTRRLDLALWASSSNKAAVRGEGALGSDRITVRGGRSPKQSASVLAAHVGSQSMGHHARSASVHLNGDRKLYTGLAGL